MNAPANFDAEKALDPNLKREVEVPSGSASDDGNVYTSYEEKLPWATRMGINADSFKRRTNGDKHNSLNKTMKTRHLHMIAIGGSIGAGLFVGSGSALRKGGPAALIIGFGIIGIMIFNVVYALGELAYVYPISGGFYTYSTRFIDPSWGFAMGWNYVFQWAIVLPLELVVAALVVQSFDGEQPNIGIFITIFLVAITVISIFGVLGYAEEEFWVSMLKLVAVIVFLIMSFVFVLGGGPSDGKFSTYQGGKRWQNPGAFANGFLGVCQVFVTAAFSFSGTELVGLAAAESKTPQKSLPGAIKQVFWRITLFYILSLLFVGLLVDYNDPRLIGAPGSSGLINPSTSPFAIVAIDAGVPGFGIFINVVVLLAVVSIGLSGVYGGSRTLCALAEQGYAPKIFTYIDKAGRPLFATIAIIAFGPLAYLTYASSGETVFNWLLSLSGLAALFTWGSICLAHIRYRAAWAYNGHSLDELPFKAIFGVYGSWIGLILVVLVLIAQLYTAIQPMDVENFFLSYLAIFVVLLFYIIGYVWKRGRWIKIHEIDIDSGRRAIDYEAFEAEKLRTANHGAFRKFMGKMF